jgi:hypothetical protein
MDNVTITRGRRVDRANQNYQRRAAQRDPEFEMRALRRSQPAFVELVAPSIRTGIVSPYRRFYLPSASPHAVATAAGGLTLICWLPGNADDVGELPVAGETILLTAFADIDSSPSGALLLHGGIEYYITTVIDTARTRGRYTVSKIVCFEKRLIRR